MFLLLLLNLPVGWDGGTNEGEACPPPPPFLGLRRRRRDISGSFATTTHSPSPS